jgi:ADP-heptose:LPS heptosyltransferase
LFASLLPALRQRVGQISLRVDDRLVALLARSFPDIEMLPASLPLSKQRFKQHSALGSLPRYFLGQSADFNQLARYLRPDPLRVAHLQAAWASRPRPWLGVSWRSINPYHDKSIPIEQVATALRGYPGTLINLQYGHTAAELNEFAKFAGQPLMNDPQLDLFNDLEAVVALISLCDRVVTISNVTAHLSGAQGADTLLMVPGTTMHRHWYWHANNGRSLWYPTVSVITQPVIGRWQKVLGQVRKEVMG